MEYVKRYFFKRGINGRVESFSANRPFNLINFQTAGDEILRVVANSANSLPIKKANPPKC